MHPAHTITTDDTGTPRRSLWLRVSAGAATVATVTLATLALWPASNADKAREDGEQLGRAVYAVQTAETQAEMDDALFELEDAVAQTADNAGDAVADEAAEFEDAVSRAVDGYVGMNTADDSLEADLYEAELDYAVDDLDDQAADLGEGVPEVQEAFWEGYEDGYESA